VIPAVGPDKDDLTLDEGLRARSPEADHLLAIHAAHLRLLQQGNRRGPVGLAGARAEPKGKKVSDLVKTPGDLLRNELSGLLRPELIDLLAPRSTTGKDLRGPLRAQRPGTDQRARRIGTGRERHPGKWRIQAARQRREQAGPVDAPGKDPPLRSDRSKPAFRAQQVRRVLRQGGKPLRVLTGSTNWTSSGALHPGEQRSRHRGRRRRTGLPGLRGIASTPPATDTPPPSSRRIRVRRLTDVDGCKVTPWVRPHAARCRTWSTRGDSSTVRNRESCSSSSIPGLSSPTRLRSGGRCCRTFSTAITRRTTRITTRASTSRAS